MPGDQVEVVRRAAEAFARRDNEAVVRDYADDIVWDMSHYDGWPGQPEYAGIEGIRSFFREWIAPWDEWSWKPTEIVDAGDAVLVSGYDHGRLQGSDAEVERHLAQLWTVENGRIARITTFRSREQALSHLSRVP